MHSKWIGSVLFNILSCTKDRNTFHQSFVTVRLKIDQITSTQVAADRGALRIWRWVSLTEGRQKFWSQWQLADTAWLACARAAATRSAAELPSNAPTQSHSLQRIHPHLNSIFASKFRPGPTSMSYLYLSHSLTRSTSFGSCHSYGDFHVKDYRWHVLSLTWEFQYPKRWAVVLRRCPRAYIFMWVKLYRCNEVQLHETSTVLPSVYNKPRADSVGARQARAVPKCFLNTIFIEQYYITGLQMYNIVIKTAYLKYTMLYIYMYIL